MVCQEVQQQMTKKLYLNQEEILLSLGKVSLILVLVLWAEVLPLRENRGSVLGRGEE